MTYFNPWFHQLRFKAHSIPVHLGNKDTHLLGNILLPINLLQFYILVRMYQTSLLWGTLHNVHKQA